MHILNTWLMENFNRICNLIREKLHRYVNIKMYFEYRLELYPIIGNYRGGNNEMVVIDYLSVWTSAKSI